MKLDNVKNNLNKTSPFKIKEISKNLFLVIHNSRRDSAFSFLRFQEFYESPKYKGKKINIEEYYNYYKENFKTFSYHKDWAGFNISLDTIRSFNKKHKNLYRKEKDIYNSFKKLKKAYIIGVNKNEDRSVYMHEVAHGLFYLNKDYKKDVLKILKNRNLTDINKVLKKMGYHKSVFLDEIQAYMCFSLSDLKKYGLNTKKYKNLKNKIQSKFYYYLKN